MLLVNLVFGLLAWLFPCLALMNVIKKKWIALSLSVLMCTVAVVASFYQVKIFATEGALSAIQDTIGVEMMIVAVLMVVTGILNAFMVFKTEMKENH